MQLKHSLSSVSAFPLHGSDQSSAGPRFLITPAASLFFFLATSQWVSSTAHPPYSALADGCLAVYSSESLNKSACNWGEAKELEEEKRETKAATGESVSISCRWSLDAIQLLLVLLLLLLRKESGGEKGRGYYSRREREWEKKLVPESVSVREKTLRTKERRCSAEDNQRGRNRERERELQTEGVMEGERERQREREGGWKKYCHVYAYTSSVTMLKVMVLWDHCIFSYLEVLETIPDNIM